jgi:ribonuclease HI
MAKKKKYYVVWEGNEPGIYSSWTECQLQIKGYPNARYKSFASLEEAQEAFSDSPQSHLRPKGKKKTTSPPSSFKEEIEWKSLSVDAACSGNPGKMEYQGVDTATGDQIFHQQFQRGTNNIGEFLALVHGLAYLKQHEDTRPIYTDSKIALGWVRKKKCKTKLAHTRQTARLFELIERAESWLQKNTFENQILKWNTERWGEIPADFGRK